MPKALMMRSDKLKIEHGNYWPGFHQLYARFSHCLNCIHRLTLFSVLLLLCFLTPFQPDALAESIESPSSVKTTALTAEEAAWLATHQDIRLGVLQSWAPVAFLNNKKQFSGLSQTS
jgi:hypothetical protein